MTTLRCRPSEAEKEPILVFVSATQMLNLKLKNGSPCRISNLGGDLEAVAISWLTTRSDLKDGVIGISKWLQDRCEIKLGNEIVVTKIADELQDDTAVVHLRPLDVFDFDKKLLWELLAVDALSENYRYMAPLQKVTIVAGRQRKDFEIVGPVKTVYKATSISQVRIGAETERPAAPITFESIGGLQKQKEQLRRIAHHISERGTKAKSRRHHSPLQQATGILLYGPAGTGKSLLRKALEAEHNWADIVTWKGSGSKVANLSASQLVHINIRGKLSQLDASTLEEVFNACSPTTLIVAEIRDPNDLQSFLRTGSAFKHEIEVSIPDASQRHEILSLLNNGLLDEDLLREAAQKTHGYVGDDLSRLLGEVESIIDGDAETESATDDSTTPSATQDVPNGQPHPHSDHDQNNGSVGRPPTTIDHLVRALTHIRPSALQQVFLEKPDVKWSDIGGQEIFKERLRNAVEWPLRYPQELKSYNIPQKKGILLYGPPGCSKTMLVKALATESDYNFLAVKGAELISMYVGESERATREVFRKARAASPCIIFFDEIDAIARRANDSSMLNVLTTLLNEMDGFEELKDVFVVAATNKPQTIDPALMRPGRFDNVVYIGPPDPETRKAIFLEQFRRTLKLSDKARDKVGEYVLATEDLSGAEVVAICQLAGEIAFSSDQTIQRDILAEDIFEAIKRTPRSITTQMLAEYESWNAERAAR
ncbi:AAA+-type ATPase [Lithohypha guttulata]|uniref:AAA+-type ATPase n=1 Tax=Lithohypha guttulata TaxID=1690604 RepID=A0AAN7Y965_9EURO|nr:AAA+-type ATPase [Lithohypha guttulata]